MRKTAFCIYKYKDADQLRGNRKADQPICFYYIRLVQFLFYPNTKFKASSHLLSLCSLVCVGPGRFSHNEAQLLWLDNKVSQDFNWDVF